MKVIVAGSSNITQYGLIEEAITESGFTITELVSDGFKLGELWAKERNITIKQFLSDGTNGKYHRLINNSKMLDYSEALIVVFNDNIKGTSMEYMIEEATKRKLKLFVMMV